MVAKFFKDVQITDTIVNSCRGLVGFRSFQRKILRHGFPKNKIFFYTWLTKSSMKLSFPATIASLIGHLYLSVALILFLLQIPERGQPFRRQMIVLWACFPTHCPLDILHLFLVDFLCTRVLVRALAAADDATGWALSSVPVHATGRARSDAPVN